jgi:hypothetical protein
MARKTVHPATSAAVFEPRLDACCALDAAEANPRCGSRGAGDRFAKVTTALSGGVSLSLAVAVLMPGRPLLVAIAIVVGVMGGSYLVKRYG